METDDRAQSAVARLRALREHRRRTTGRLGGGEIPASDISAPDEAGLSPVAADAHGFAEDEPPAEIQSRSLIDPEPQPVSDPDSQRRQLVAEALRGLLSGVRRDRAIWDHEWLRGCLGEVCPDQADSMETNLLVLASSERIPPALLECDGPEALEIALGRFVAGLVLQFGTSEVRARWVVHAWAWALNLVDGLMPLAEPAPSSGISGEDPENGYSGGTYEGPPLAQLIVDQSGLGHFRSIGEALEHAQAGGTIKVLAGIYPERFMVTRAISIVGSDDRGDVVITASQPYVIAVDELAWMKLEKVTVRMMVSPTRGGAAVTVISGEVTVDDCEISSISGDGVNAIGRRTSVLVLNTMIKSSGVYGVRGREYARLVIENCTIRDCGSAGIVIKELAHLTVKETQIMGGMQHGILAIDRAEGFVENCVIRQNGSAGVSVATGASLVVVNCNIANNFRGIVLSQTGSATVTSCVLEKNARNWLIEPGARFTGRDNVPPV